MDDLIFYTARGMTKTTWLIRAMCLDYISRKKKKKAFLKLLRSLGYKWNMIEDYVKWITLSNQLGKKIEYSYIGFVSYIIRNYYCCERNDEHEFIKIAENN